MAQFDRGRVAELAATLRGEFAAHNELDPQLIRLAILEGIFPMTSSEAGAETLLLLKSHKRRCIVDAGALCSCVEPSCEHSLACPAGGASKCPEGCLLCSLGPGRRLRPTALARAHCPSKVKKKAKKYALRVSCTDKAAYDRVCDGIRQFTYSSTPGDCWLTPGMQRAYWALNERTALQNRLKPGSAPADAPETPVLYSTEILDIATQQLVAGEIGWRVGTSYTSATGFYDRSFPGTGTLQLVCLGRWLGLCGCRILDLGMTMDYKVDLLGASTIKRAQFLELVQQRRLDRGVVLDCEATCCAELLARAEDAAQLQAGGPPAASSAEKAAEERNSAPPSSAGAAPPERAKKRSK